jgi:hypothetical protein
MGPLVAVLLIIVLLAVLGLAGVAKILFWIAVILALLWVIGFFVRSAEGARWYRW